MDYEIETIYHCNSEGQDYYFFTTDGIGFVYRFTEEELRDETGIETPVIEVDNLPNTGE